MFKIVGHFGPVRLVPCLTCNGTGKTRQEPTIATRSGVHGFNARGAINVPGTGCTIPCPACRGSRVMAIGGETRE